MSTTLINGIVFPLAFKDGRVVDVTYRTLEVAPLYRFLRAAHTADSPTLVAICTDKPAEFFRGVEPKSFAQLAAACFNLNFPLALELAEDPVAGAMIAPLMASMAMAATATENPALAAALAKLPGKKSSDSSSAPAPSGSATAIGTGSSSPTPSSA